MGYKKRMALKGLFIHSKKHLHALLSDNQSSLLFILFNKVNRLEAVEFFNLEQRKIGKG